LDVGPGDEVILPSFTFVSTATAFALRGATCVFVDIDPVSMNICPQAVAAAVTANTKAIVAVHYGGVGADMAQLLEIGRASGAVVVEDAAQGMGATRGGQALGSFGALAAVSFHETKNIHCGEGGALLINDEQYIGRAEILRDKGTDRAQYFRGEVDKYTWRDLGSSFGSGQLSAAFLLAQLESLQQVTQARRLQWKTYETALEPLVSRGLVTLGPSDPGGNGHLFFVKLADTEQREQLRIDLHQNGIQAATHYVPLHTSPGGLRWGRFAGEEKYTTQDASRLLRLPIYPQLQSHEVDKIIAATRDFLETVSE